LGQQGLRSLKGDNLTRGSNFVMAIRAGSFGGGVMTITFL